MSNAISAVLFAVEELIGHHEWLSKEQGADSMLLDNDYFADLIIAMRDLKEIKNGNNDKEA